MSPLVLPGPLFFFLALLLLGALAYALNRWALLAGGIAAGGCLLLAWFALRRLGGEALVLPGQEIDLLGRGVEVKSTFELLGRTWALTESSLAGLGLLLALSGLCFLLALPTPHGWAFYPFGLITLAALALALTAQQFVYALLFIWLAGCLSVFVLAGGRPGDTTAALRALVFVSLGVMPLLLLQRYLPPDAAGYVGVPGAAAPPLGVQAGQTATLLMTAGLAILLMMVPFHGQLVAMGAHAAPMAVPFMLTAMPTVVLHTFFRLWEVHPALLTGQFAFDVCRWTGIAALVLGGLGALGQRRWGALVGHVTLVDWGAGLMAMGMGTRAGTEWMVQMLVWRALGLLLVGVGWGALFDAAGKRDDLEHCAEPVRRQPLAVAALVLGLLSLAGFPLAPGGLDRWLLLDRAVLSQPLVDWPPTMLVRVLAGAAASLGTVFALGACVGTKGRPQATDDDRRPTSVAAADGEAAAGDEGQAPAGEDENAAEAHRQRERRARRRQTLETLLGASASLLALGLIGGFLARPAPWIELAQRLVGGLTFPGG
jgi:formate hydrogenlyase subunit 3/multisubunit Na+/H+ antiporter MnhD subunit